MIRKIFYLFTVMFIALSFVQNVSADAQTVCTNTDDIVAMLESESVAKTTAVNAAGTQCIISVSSNGKQIGNYYDTISSGANSSNCSSDRYSIVYISDNNYNIVRRECTTSYVAPPYDTKTITCGNVKGIPRGLTFFSRSAVSIIKLLVPVILIVLGIIDMLRASSANDEKIMKDATSKFIRRIVAAILVFFVVSLIQFVVKTISNSAKESNNEDVENDANNIMSCISCFISDKDDCVLDNYLEE